ncbi:MAG TPA: hypothetical protein VG323_22600 [Thermoanaerobaculia bacterium]|nr:hypothetical protein [Thermoanaerobaculia bacterium]
MAITMQGSWTVSVKSAEAFEPKQRFIISGAISGNGTYGGATSTPPVHVTGTGWQITVQILQGSTWITEHDRITFPHVSGGQYRFDIEANRPDNDPDWDDLILTCSRPVSWDTFVIYGSVSHYSGNCLFNPCNRRFLAIETQAALTAALQHPVLRDPLTKLYPQRVIPRPGPIPDPPPFVPLVLPLETASLPAKEGVVFQRAATVAKAAKGAADGGPQVTAIRKAIQPQSLFRSIEIDRLSLSKYIDRFFIRCQSGPLPGISLRFLEYDRTSAELAGDPYTGNGTREDLGTCTTDAQGNYIFLFTRTGSDFVDEGSVDTGLGENFFTQWFPDVIVQVVAIDPAHPAGFSYESAPYWNIPNLKRIDICVPDSEAPLPKACQGNTRAIQFIGNIFIDQATNPLDGDGRITTHSTFPNTPRVQCAAWAGLLDFYACFTAHPDVTWYTIRYRHSASEDWSYFTENFRALKKVHPPGIYNGELIGPFERTLTVDGSADPHAKAYMNIENDDSYVEAHRSLKAWINSGNYPPSQVTVLGNRELYGSVTFRIEGYNDAGNKVPGADDSITLYINNNGPLFDIPLDGVKMFVNGVEQDGGVCALFNLDNHNFQALNVKFRALHEDGFLGSYGLSVRKGNSSGFQIDGPSSISGAYTHGADDPCNTFEGTLDVPTHDGSGYITVDITPHNGWLDDGQNFCTFAVQVSCSTRVTNGYWAGTSYGPTEYLLGIQRTSGA